MLLNAFGKKACPGLVAQHQTRRMRKLYLFILLVPLVLTCKANAQSITLTVDNAPLDTVFARIQVQTPYRFVYTSEELTGTRKVSFSVQKVAIKAVLALCFKDQPVDYSMENSYIYVRKKEQSKIAPPLPNKTSDIRGKIVNQHGDLLEGASVEINRLRLRTITNLKGEFLIRNIPYGNYELEITFIGYEKSNIITKVSQNSPELTITMKRLINNLDETIIKGYYSTTIRDNTGDVVKLRSEDIEKSPVTDPVLAMDGRVSGLYISGTNGIPGSNTTGSNQIYLRGRNSIASGISPLFIVDGVPFTSTSLTSTALGGGAAFLSPFNTIDPNDIDNIEILKDADATAIYGSRGANGVILITTKKGSSGATHVSLNYSDGAGKVDRMIPLLNSQQYLEMRHEAFLNDGKNPGPSDYDLNGSWDTTRYTNWQKTLIGGTAHLLRGEATISGGNGNTQFLMGGGFSRQTTVYPGDYYDEVGSAHFNVTHNSSDKKFHGSLSAYYANDHSILPTSDLTSLITLPPIAPPVYVNGALNWQQNAAGVYTFNNPFALLLQDAKATTDNLIATWHCLMRYYLVFRLQ